MNIKVFVSKMYSDKLLIEVDGKTPTFEQTKKAIMLINKSPEMLEMLKNIQSETDPHGNSKRWNEIQKLIKEATEL